MGSEFRVYYTRKATANTEYFTRFQAKTRAQARIAVRQGIVPKDAKVLRIQEHRP